MRRHRRDPAGRENAPCRLRVIAGMHGRCALWSAAVPAAPRRPSSQPLPRQRVGVFRQPSAYSRQPGFPIASSSAKGFPRDNVGHIKMLCRVSIASSSAKGFPRLKKSLRRLNLIRLNRFFISEGIPTLFANFSGVKACVRLNRFFISEGIPAYATPYKGLVAELVSIASSSAKGFPPTAT